MIFPMHILLFILFDGCNRVPEKTAFSRPRSYLRVAQWRDLEDLPNSRDLICSVDCMLFGLVVYSITSGQNLQLEGLEDCIGNEIYSAFS